MRLNQTKIDPLPIHWKIKTLNEISSVPISNGLYKPKITMVMGQK